VDELEALGVTREAFGFGGADLGTLNQIDSNDAVIFDDVGDIIGAIDVALDGGIGPALAETDVFAQVDASGAFSFGEALAAIG